jgi:hypothetical protein
MIQRVPGRETAMTLANRMPFGLTAGRWGGSGRVSCFDDHVEGRASAPSARQHGSRLWRMGGVGEGLDHQMVALDPRPESGIEQGPVDEIDPQLLGRALVNSNLWIKPSRIC